MRIGIVGLSIEILLASPLETGIDLVQEYDAAAIRDGDIWLVRGMLQRIARETEIRAVPLYWATALPGGPLTADAYAAIKDKTLSLIRKNGPFDGMLVANHGALEVAGLNGDADADYVSAVRGLVGPSVPIGVALDLHGDMTPGLLAAATLFSVLRTAPHRDDRETGYRAADQLIRVLRTSIVPKKAAVRIPILVPGEAAVTTFAPADELYGTLPEYDARPGMMEANILVGFAWNDRPWTSMTVLAVTEGDAELARETADGLAARIWARREDFQLRMETAMVDEGLRRAQESRERPVFVSNSGDNTTAGAPGDLTFVLQKAIDLAGVDDLVVAGITAPATARRCIIAGVGAKIEIALGAEHLSRPETDRRVEATVLACGETLRLRGFQPYRNTEGPWACAKIGNIVATFHARPIGITTPHHFEAMGIHPTAHQAYVVKLGYLHPQLEDIAGRGIVLLSDGTTQLDMKRFAWNALLRPIYPLDADMNWQPDDESRYGDWSRRQSARSAGRQ